MGLLYLLGVLWDPKSKTFPSKLQIIATTLIILPALLLFVHRRLFLGLPYDLLFFPAWIYSINKIILISAQQNDSMQLPNSGVALG